MRKRDGAEMAVGGLGLFGYNAYFVRIGSGQKFRVALNEFQMIWKVRRGTQTIMTMGRGTDEWPLDIRSTGLWSRDLAALVCLTLIFRHTLSTDQNGSGAAA